MTNQPSHRALPILPKIGNFRYSAKRFGPAPHGFPVQAWEYDMLSRGPRPGPYFNRARLVAEPLEERFALAQHPVWQLAVQSHSYASDTVLIRTHDKAALPIPITHQKAFSGIKRLASGVYEVHLQSQTTVADAVRILQSLPEVISVEPNYRIQLTAIPNDPLFTSQWALANSHNPGADIRALAAWEINTNASNVTVAVIDTGIDYTHPDLAANMWRNSQEIPNNGLDDDSNGYIDDVFGYDFVNDDGNPVDDHGHGTLVAGIIGAVANNGQGIAGVAWNVRLLAVKFLNASGSGTVADAVRAIDYAVQMGARIINASWGGAGYSSILAQAISRAENAGVLFVASAGNNATNNDQTPYSPASFPNANIIAVAATDRNDNLAAFSNFGPTTVHLAAPGVGIVSTFLNEQYTACNGTSMAAPHVSGAAVLLWAMHPDWNFRQIKERLLQTVDKLPSLQGKVISGGRLNLERALQSLPNQDNVGPRVLTVTWNRTVHGLHGARVTFSEAVANFSADAVAVTGPSNQRVHLLSIRRVDNSLPGSTFDLVFATQTQPGTYTIQIGPNVSDLAGNLMDQNGDGIAGDPIQDRYVAHMTLTPTYVYRSGTLNAPIRDYATTTTLLTVSHRLNITKLQLQVYIEHTWTADLVITLTSPAGRTVTLVNRRGGSGDNFVNTIFTDDADAPIAAGTAPFRGSYRPEQSLAVFRNQGGYGTWTLRVQDLARGDTGRVVHWSLYLDGLRTASVGARRTSGNTAPSVTRLEISSMAQPVAESANRILPAGSIPFAALTLPNSLSDRQLGATDQARIPSMLQLMSGDLERYAALMQVAPAISANLQNPVAGSILWQFTDRDLESLAAISGIGDDLDGMLIRYSKQRVGQ